MAKDRSKYFNEYQKERMKNPLLRERHQQACKASRERQTPEQRERRLAAMRALYYEKQARDVPDKSGKATQKAAKIKDRRGKVCELRQMGATARQVAEMLGVSIITVFRDSKFCK